MEGAGRGKTATLNPGITVVTDEVKEAGAVVWWTLSGEVDLAALGRAWTFDPRRLPKAPTPAAALRVAVLAQQKKGVLARPLGRNDGWALVDEVTGDGGRILDHRMSYRVFTEQRKIRVEWRRPDGEWVSAVDNTSVALLQGFERALTVLQGSDIGGWLTDQVEGLRGVALRATGGIYFLPKAALEDWRGVAHVLRAMSSHTLYELPALKSDEAVKAIMDAILGEAERAEAAMAADLAAGAFGAKGLQVRAIRCGEVMEKVAIYEELLGESMGQMRARLLTLRANLVAAALAAEAE